MKATGIVRRIDDLGRVVIPKEIRRTLHIRDGDPLEIYTEKDGEVIFKKYSPVNELSEFAEKICDALWKSGESPAVICDRDSVIACGGTSKKGLNDRRVSEAVTALMETRKSYVSQEGAHLPLLESGDQYITTAAPIIAEGDLLGYVAFIGDKGAPAPTEVQIKLVSTVAAFLSKHMES